MRLISRMILRFMQLGSWPEVAPSDQCVTRTLTLKLLSATIPWRKLSSLRRIGKKRIVGKWDGILCDEFVLYMTDIRGKELVQGNVEFMSQQGQVWFISRTYFPSMYPGSWM